MTREIEDAITERSINIWKTVPNEIKKLISLANNDLYYGPTYLNKDNEPVSMFDEDYDHAFDFQGACEEIKECMDSLVSDFVVTECGSTFDSENDMFKFYYQLAKEEGYHEESINYPEYSIVDAKEILYKIVGKELISYL